MNPNPQGIKKGDLITIKPNVAEELRRMEFTSPDNLNDLIGTTQTAYDVYEADKDQFDGNSEWFVTIDLCVEVPIAACELASSYTGNNAAGVVDLLKPLMGD